MKNMEKRVIASLLMGGLKEFKIHGQVAGIFVDPSCKKLFDRMSSFAHRGHEWDMVSMANEFPGDPDITPEYLLELSNIADNHYSITSSIQSLQDLRFRNHAYSLIQQYQEMTAAELSEKLQAEIWKYHGGLPAGWERHEAFQRMLDSIEYDMEHGVEFRTGIGSLDGKIGGLYRKEVTFIGARPSTGKTALAVTIAMNLIIAVKKVLYIDLESGDEPMMERFCCLDSGVPMVNIRRRFLSTEQASKVIKSANKLKELPITINDRAGITTGMIYNQALNLGTEVIILDYLNLMVKNSSQEVGELGDIMLGMNTLSKELNIPVIVLGQLNRQLETRTDKRPQISDIRGSGKIEEYSTNIHLLHWPYIYDDRADQKEYFIYCRKQKHGPVGPIQLEWDAPHMKFKETKENKEWKPV